MTLYAKIHSIELVIRTDHLVALLTAPVISRTMLVLSCTVLPYAREDGTGKAFGMSRWTIHLLPAIAICVLGVFLLHEMRGLLVLAQAAAITALFSLYCYKRIGGYTGDTLGFLNELIEISCLLATCLFF